MSIITWHRSHTSYVLRIEQRKRLEVRAVSRWCGLQTRQQKRRFLSDIHSVPSLSAKRLRKRTGRMRPTWDLKWTFGICGNALLKKKKSDNVDGQLGFLFQLGVCYYLLCIAKSAPIRYVNERTTMNCWSFPVITHTVYHLPCKHSIRTIVQ